MFILNPDPFSTPTYRIGPFQTQFISRNNKINDSWADFAIEYFNERFGKNNWLVTLNGREAMSLALKELNLKKNDVVSILTPSNNFYISSCVTNTIANCSKWNRINQQSTSVIFINHEFGYVYSNMKLLKNQGLPIIEDCCTTFFSQDEHNKIGNYGDYALYSFPKFFNIQIGGLLVGKNVALNVDIKSSIQLSQTYNNYILKVMGYELSNKIELLNKRKHIIEYATEQYNKLGFTLRFPNLKDIIPSVLLLNNNGIIKDLNKHKEYLYKHGIQNSVFYGEDAFFLPCHQNMEEIDVDYILEVSKNYMLNYGIK